MHQKRPSSEAWIHVQPKRRFFVQVSDMFLSNDVNAEKFASLVQNARIAGARNCDIRLGSAKNLSRDVRRQLLKKSAWPKPYIVSVPCMDPKSNEIVSMQVPMWLPHEILFVLGSKLPASVWTSRAHASPLILGHLSETETKLKMPPGTLAGVGIWSDGVPFNNNRTKSLELGSMSLPCLDSDFRVPLWCIGKDFLAPNVTMKTMIVVLKWSLEILAAGTMPSTRHDGTPWRKSDVRRAKWSGDPVQRAILVQIRGDWACSKQHFNLAGFLDRCRQEGMHALHALLVHTSAQRVGKP